ncbi:F-box protein SKIP24 [Silene latifolia]|uniref:F-box protein SKIP24 n=1 Tax=Silene latifolia TaxID=37657 RepID=UPI003D783A63
MADLPDELWTKILENGIRNPNSNTRLTFKDLCCLSLVSRCLHRLSNDLSLWSSLLSLDFPSRLSQNPTISPKSIYESWYEKDKAKRIAAEKRAVMRVESIVAEHGRRVEDFRRQRVDEEERIHFVVSELNNLRRVRQASVALNVWQPEVVRGRQKQIVEQCAVPVDSRINALEMELKLCKQQMIDFERAYRAEKRRLDQAKERLTSMKYHPLQDHSVNQNSLDDHKIRSTVDSNRKRRKCKTSSDDVEG